MSLLDRVRDCHAWDPEDYRTFVVGDRAMGRMPHDFAKLLRDYPKVFEVGGAAVRLRDELGGFAERSAAVQDVVTELHLKGAIPYWRGEFYPVVRHWGEEPVMKLERGASGLFGIRAFGVHLNGLVMREEGLFLWIGRRAPDRNIEPGKLDHLVAGGQPHGLGVFENLMKEAEEEAGIPAEIARRAKPVSLVSYRCRRKEGLRDDVLFVYDLELSEDFTPHNRDGELAEFFLWPIEKAIEVIAAGKDFKFNVALVVIDLLIRRGFLRPDDPDYHEIAEGLRTP